jgi:hypothetical protein
MKKFYAIAVMTLFSCQNDTMNSCSISNSSKSMLQMLYLNQKAADPSLAIRMNQIEHLHKMLLQLVES